MEDNFREQCVVIFLSSNISISWVYLSVLFRTSYIGIHLRYNNGDGDEIQTHAGAAQWNSVNNSIIGNLSGFRLEKDYWNNYIEHMDFFFFRQMVSKMVIKRKLYCSVHVGPIRTSCLKV